MSKASGARGFTLIELMIVVAIVGVLSVLAVVGYRKIVLSSHTSEATHMVQAIRLAEEAYHAETQAYVGTSTDAYSNWYPQDPRPLTTPQKMGWGTATGACATANVNCWGLLPVHVDGPVMFGYTVAAGTAGTALTGGWPTTGMSPTPPGPPTTTTTDWYWITAINNMSGVASTTTAWVMGSSFTNDIYIAETY